uniref:Endonuclease/exonuclease/phosphatase domain-containing protein n=1 Tax=Tetranychus urticae TaxID=32264 RepID=T1JSP6_TETUR
MSEFCVSNRNLYKKHDLLWHTLSYIERSYSDVKCVVCFQELGPTAYGDFQRGYAAKLDKQAARSPTKRAFWKYEQVSNLLTCFTRKYFPGIIQIFKTNRTDFMVAVVESAGKKIDVINCHQNCNDKADRQLYLAELFGAVMSLQSGGQDAKGVAWGPVHGLVLAVTEEREE